MEFKDYLKVIRRRWLWFAGVVVLFCAIFSLMYVREKAQYLATAKLVIKVETADIVISDSTLRPQAPGLSSSTREALLTSEPVLRNAVFLYGAQVALAEEVLNLGAAPVKAAFEKYEVPVDKAIVTKADLAAGLLELVKDKPLPPDLGPGTFGDLLEDKSEAHQRIAERLGTVKAARVSDKIQVVHVTCMSFDSVDAARLVNAVAYAGEDWSNKDTKQNVEKTLEKTKRDQETLIERKKGLALKAAELSKYESARALKQTALQQYQQRIEQLQSERRRVERLIEKEHGEDHNNGTPFARVIASTEEVRNISSQLRDVVLQIENVSEVHTPEARDYKQLVRRKKVLETQLAAAKATAVEERRANQKAEIAFYNEEIGEVTKRINEVTTEIATLSDDIDRLLPEREELGRVQDSLARMTEVQTRLATLFGLLEGFIKVQKPADTGLPQPKSMQKSWAFWLLMSMVVGLGVCYFREYLDTSILTEYDVRRHLNIPVLGLIPEMSDMGEGGGWREGDLDRAPLSETFNTIGTLVRTAMGQEGWKSILIASANPSEGKTFVSIQLALSLARKGLRVVLIDSDMRKPQIHAMLGLENATGLSSILEGRMEARGQVGEAIGEAAPGSTLDAYLQKTDIPNLSVITSGPVPSSPVQLLESQRMRDLMAELRERADFIIFDTPPICSVGDSITLATIVDVVLYVVGAGYSEQQDATWAKHLLNNVQANLLGVVMNRMEQDRSREYYYYYTRDRKNVRTGT